MKKMTAYTLCVCGAMIALHVILEYVCNYFSVLLFGNSLKISISSLPIILCGMLFGPLVGAVVGTVSFFLSQLLTFGVTVTTPLWVLPGLLVGLCAGFVFKAFRKRAEIVPVGVTAAAGCVMLVIANLFASYMDGVVIYKYLTPEVLVLWIPGRLIVCAGLIVVYTALALPIYKGIGKISR